MKSRCDKIILTIQGSVFKTVKASSCMRVIVLSYSSNFILINLKWLFPAGFPISGFQVDAVDQVVLNLQDEVQQTWKPGDQVVVASTDYSMHQAEEFTLLPCPRCTSRQVRVQGKREDNASYKKYFTPRIV